MTFLSLLQYRDKHLDRKAISLVTRQNLLQASKQSEKIHRDANTVVSLFPAVRYVLTLESPVK